MPAKYVKTKYRGVFLRSGIAYIRYAVPGKKRGSVVWESTGQRNTQLAAERLRQHHFTIRLPSQPNQGRSRFAAFRYPIADDFLGGQSRAPKV